MNTTKPKAMRDLIIEGVRRKMEDDKQIFFVTADFGSPALDLLRDQFTGRFCNVGIAEQNLINVSMGLALEGYTVFAYAIAPFISMRAFEQIRTDLSLHASFKKLNVNLLSVGAGMSYDISGPTHHCLEDLTLMRMLPHIELLSPCDANSAVACLDFCFAQASPKYLRLDSKPLGDIYTSAQDQAMTDGFGVLQEGSSVCLVSTGYMTHSAVAAARRLSEGIGVIDVFRFKPESHSALRAALDHYDGIITLEEGFVGAGGLDSMVRGLIANDSKRKRTRHLGVKDHRFEGGGREYLHHLEGIDEQQIVKTTLELLRECRT